MKLISILAAILFIAGPVIAQTSQQKMVKSTFSQSYIPTGFDDNDPVEFVGEGMLPNTCYKPAATKWKLSGNDIIIAPRALLSPGYCLEVLVPHNEVVELGVLPAGTYNVIHDGSGEKLGVLEVTPTKTPGHEDYLYAPVSVVNFHDETGPSLVDLSGTFTNNCMQLAEVKTSIQQNVIVVQPIVKSVNSGVCQDGSYPFKYTMEIKNAPSGRYLLNVRTFSGKSVNNLIDIR